LRDALFPWLEPGVVPQTTEGLSVLLAQSAVQQRLATLGVGWLVVFTAHDAPSKKNEHMLCAGGFGAGACPSSETPKNTSHQRILSLP
jgi:hypothetical protein